MDNSIVFYVVLVLALAGCSDQAVDVGPAVSWGAADKVVPADNIYFAGQPDRRTLEKAREAGVGTVINLRLPDEMDWDEAAESRELGMDYVNIPVSRSGPGFDSAAIERLHQFVAEHPDEKILMHCSSGNRASAWYAIYLVEKKGYEFEAALPIAEQTGLTQPGLVDRIRFYLDQT